MKKRVIVGISGGVDSAVAALLLQKQGHEVQGIFMQNWDDPADPFCSANQDWQDAKAVCKHLAIPLQMVRFAEAYWDRVFQHFLNEYAAGRTPNPDILCNQEIKFKAFLDYAITQGADYMATGHYARSRQTPNGYELLRGLDETKDQSYFLYTLQQHPLARSLFPVGSLPKTEVRAIAAQAGFGNAHKKDSTGICFIGERKFKNFLSEYLLARPGEIHTTAGKIIGQHQGLMFYTLGQRQGLGIGGQAGGKELPWYVVHKDIAKNVLIVDQQHDHPWLLQPRLLCHQLHWVAGTAPTMPFQCSAKTRYRQKDAACTVSQQDTDCLEVTFTEPQWAITPGQSVVFYQEERCIGGGVILESPE